VSVSFGKHTCLVPLNDAVNHVSLFSSESFKLLLD